MSSHFTAGLVGLGRIGFLYDAHSPCGPVLTHARALSGHPGWRLAWGVDPDPDRRALFSSLLKVPAHASLPSSPEATCDLIVLATPPKGRLELVKACLAMRPRLLLLEKPLADSVAAGQAILDLCRQAGTAIAVNYHRRCEPATRRLKSLLDAYKFSHLCAGRVICSGGLRHNASHFVDLARYLLGEPEAADIVDWPGREQTGDDDVSFTLLFSGAPVVFQALSGCTYSHADMELFFRNGAVRYAAFGRSVTMSRTIPDPLYPGYTELETPVELTTTEDFERNQWHVADHLYRVLAENQPLASNGENALATLTLCEELTKRWKRPA